MLAYGLQQNERVAELRIGTSGWHYKHWLGNFYPPRWPTSRMLEHYLQHFNTVELNNTFYQLPNQSSLEGWREATPPNFIFAAKGSRFLTHMKKLRNAEEGLNRYLTAILTLQPKLGPILFQLPPNLGRDLPRLTAFLEILPRDLRYTFEFRHPDWDEPEVYAALRRYGAAYCIFDLAGYQSPLQVTSDFAYVRLHGPEGKYQGSYDEDALRRWARQIQQWSRDLAAVYVYFDNDDSGYAAQNAIRLQQLISSAS
jgi:uncharacterized protein YecE (DUF72 family)